MPTFDHPYLDLARMEMLRRVRLKPRGMAEGTFSGPHKSPYRGTAVEFADFRSYTDGDDIRLVDWKVFARSDKHYVRLYEAERNLLSYLVVDTSGSMEFSGVARPTMSKLEYAGRLAAAMAYMVVDAGDEVGLSLANETVHTHLPPRASFSHLCATVGVLGDAKAEGRTNLGECLIEVFRRSKRRGVLIVLSDFLDESTEFWRRINLFRSSRFDVMLFHIVHPEEVELPEVPMARFLDSEGGPGSFLAEPDQVRRLYRDRFDAFLKKTEAGAQYRGCDWILARTDQDPYQLLQSCFLERDRGR